MKFYIFVLFCLILGTYCIHKEESKFLDKNIENNFQDSNLKIMEFFDNKITNINDINFKFKEKEKTSEKNEGIIYEGWVKIILIKGKSKSQVKFIVNDKFLKQSNFENINVHETDDKGYVNIPSKDYFYGVLTKNDIEIYTSRKEQFKTLKLSINLEDIVKQKGNTYKGGVEDIGDFKEGHCFIVKYITSSNKSILEICTESLAQKNSWMKNLVKLVKKEKTVKKEQTQDNNSEQNVDETINHNIVQSPIIPISNTISHINPVSQVISHPTIIPNVPQHNHLLVENHIAPAGAIINNNLELGINNVVALKRTGFVPVSEWTPCSKPCGIGLQSRTLQCIRPPDCEGNNFEERQCNIQTCKSDVDAHLNNLKKVSEGKWEFLGSWSICSAPCGIGYQTISRKCLTPPCTGPLIVKQTCNLRPCNSSLVKSTKVFDYTNYPECQPREMFIKIKEMTGLFYEAKIILSIEHIQILKTKEMVPYITLPLNHILSFHRDPIQPNCVDVTKDNREDIVFCPSCKFILK